MKERDLYSKLNKLITNTCAVELKICKGLSLPFSAVVEHQVRALKIAKHGVLRYKIPDCGYQNPFDIIVLAKVPAFVVIVFYKPRKPIEFLFIDIDVFMQEKEISKRKSLTEETAKKLSTSPFDN